MACPTPIPLKTHQAKKKSHQGCYSGYSRLKTGLKYGSNFSHLLPFAACLSVLWLMIEQNGLCIQKKKMVHLTETQGIFMSAYRDPPQ